MHFYDFNKILIIKLPRQLANSVFIFKNVYNTIQKYGVSKVFEVFYSHPGWIQKKKYSKKRYIMKYVLEFILIYIIYINNIF